MTDTDLLQLALVQSAIVATDDALRARRLADPSAMTNALKRLNDFLRLAARLECGELVLRENVPLPASVMGEVETDRRAYGRE